PASRWCRGECRAWCCSRRGSHRSLAAWGSYPRQKIDRPSLTQSPAGVEHFQRGQGRCITRRITADGRRAMKNGFKVWDSDTHVEPSAEVIDKYLDPGFRNRLPELQQFRTPIAATTPGSSPGRHVYRFGQISFKRILGEAAPRPEHTGRASVWMGTQQPRPGVQDDMADNRIADMDLEGVDAHFLIPTAWT